MKMKAAVLYEFKTPLKVEEVDLGGPEEGEVLVKVVGTTVCGTDVGVAGGRMPVPLPIVLGHEGAGIVKEVGKGVTAVKPGDHVILSGAASCGKCRNCVRGKYTVCEVFWPLKFGGTQPLSHFFSQSSFAEYSVVPQEVAIKIREDAPLDVIGHMACAGVTGIGSIMSAARVESGESVAIFGCGAVGMVSIMAAKLAGAGKIIGIDVADNRLELSEELGATHTINATKESPVQRIKQLTGSGADYTIVSVSNAQSLLQALEAIPSGGTCIIVGAIPKETAVRLDTLALLNEKTIKGVQSGSGRGALDIPHYIDLFMEGKLPIDRIVTKKYPLSEINNAFKALQVGEVIKPVIVF
jgi:aryl-alcohol dehydrogenase